MTSSFPTDANTEPSRWLIAAFPDEASARQAAHDATATGTSPRSIRIGHSLEALASVEAEMREVTRTPGVVGRPVFGGFVGWFLGGAFGVKRPREQLAATSATMVALPDTESARHALLAAQPTRLDAFGTGGFLLGNLLTSDPGVTG